MKKNLIKKSLSILLASAMTLSTAFTLGTTKAKAFAFTPGRYMILTIDDHPTYKPGQEVNVNIDFDCTYYGEVHTLYYSDPIPYDPKGIHTVGDYSWNYDWNVPINFTHLWGQTVPGAINDSSIDVEDGATEVDVKVKAPSAPGRYYVAACIDKTSVMGIDRDTTHWNYASFSVGGTTPTPTNHAPVVDSFTPNKTSVNPGDKVDIKAMFHDADGDAMKLSFAGANSDNFVYSNTAGANTPNYEYTTDDVITAPTAPGTYTYKVKANDGKVDSNVVSATITVNAPTPTNHAPVVDSYTPNKSSVNPGEQVDIKALYHDADGDSMNVYFTGANNSNFVFNNTAGANTPNYEYTTDDIITAPTAPGTYTYQVKVNDGKVDSNVGSATITVNTPAPTNHAPVVDSYTADKTTVNAGDQVNLKAMFHDPDGDAMNLYFTGANNSNFDYNSSVGSSSANYEYTTYNTITAPAAAGTYTYEVKANDGKVDSNIGYVTITVNCPTPPTPTPKEYLNWSDLGGSNSHMFFYFMADRLGAYSLDVFRDGALIQSQNVNATSVDGITRFPTFDPGFRLPTYPNNTLAPDATARMKFNFYVTVNGTKYLLVSDNEQSMLQVGHTYYN